MADRELKRGTKCRNHGALKLVLGPVREDYQYKQMGDGERK